MPVLSPARRMAVLCGALLASAAALLGANADFVADAAHGTAVFQPGWNVFSTPKTLESFAFSNGGTGLAFYRIDGGSWSSVAASTGVLRPLEGFAVRNSGTGAVTMSLTYKAGLSPAELLFQKTLTAGWNLLGVTTVSQPFSTIGSAATMSVDFTAGATGSLAMSSEVTVTMGNAAVANPGLGKSYAVFVNSGALYGGAQQPVATGSVDTGAVVGFTVTAPASVTVGVPFTATVTAVNALDSVVESYTGTLFLAVEGDDAAQVPHAADGYTFIASDHGSRSFTGEFVLSKTGNFRISVTDLDNDMVGGKSSSFVGAAASGCEAAAFDGYACRSCETKSVYASGGFHPTPSFAWTNESSAQRVMYENEQSSPTWTALSGSVGVAQTGAWAWSGAVNWVTYPDYREFILNGGSTVATYVSSGASVVLSSPFSASAPLLLAKSTIAYHDVDADFNESPTRRSTSCVLYVASDVEPAASVSLNGSTPNSAVLVPGNSEVELARFNLFASGDDLGLTHLYLTNSGTADLSARVRSIGLYDVNGIKLATGSLLDAGTVYFAPGSAHVIAKNSNFTVLVKAAFNDIAVAADDAKTVTLAVGTGSYTGMVVSGTVAGLGFISESTGNPVTSVTGTATANAHLLARSKPTLSAASTGEFSRHTFTVTADANNRLFLTGFAYSTNNADTGVTAAVYKDSENVGNEVATGVVFTGGVVSFDAPVEISAGTTKTFVVILSGVISSQNGNSTRTFRVTDATYLDDMDSGADVSISGIGSYTNVGLPTSEQRSTY